MVGINGLLFPNPCLLFSRKDRFSENGEGFGFGDGSEGLFLGSWNLGLKIANELFSRSTASRSNDSLASFIWFTSWSTFIDLMSQYFCRIGSHSIARLGWIRMCHCLLSYVYVSFFGKTSSRRRCRRITAIEAVLAIYHLRRFWFLTISKTARFSAIGSIDMAKSISSVN